MVETYDTMNFRPCEIERICNLADCILAYMAELRLNIVQDRKQRPFAPPVRLDDVRDGRH